MTLEFTESSASETIAYVASDAGQHLMHSSREVHREAAGTTTRRRVSRDELVTDADGGWPELIPNLRLRTNQGGMSRAQFDAVLELWTLARTSVPAVRKPGAGPSDDGTYYLAWSFSDVDTVVTYLQQRTAAAARL